MVMGPNGARNQNVLGKADSKLQLCSYTKTEKCSNEVTRPMAMKLDKCMDCMLKEIKLL
jgi:hypothetical protein